MCVHKSPCRIHIYLIRVVLVQYPPCERPAANKIRAIRAIRVLKKIFVKFGLFVFKNSERNAANKDP